MFKSWVLASNRSQLVLSYSVFTLVQLFNTQAAYRLSALLNIHSRFIDVSISCVVAFYKEFKSNKKTRWHPVTSIVATHEMEVVKYLTSEYLTVTDEGKIEFKDEGQTLCLTNTNILMLRKGVRSSTARVRNSLNRKEPYILEVIRGTELLPEI